MSPYELSIVHTVLLFLTPFLVIVFSGFIIQLVKSQHKMLMRYIYKQLVNIDTSEAVEPPKRIEMAPKIIKKKVKGKAYNPSQDLDKIMKGNAEDFFS